jgi:prepilin-type N-terminal cleavage/methylation domain-containing protein
MNAMSTASDRRETGHPDAGTTLIEMMITLAIMSIAMVIVASTLSLAQNSANRIEKSAEAIDSARLMSASLDRELRSAICILSPGENLSGNTLTFQTLAGEEVAVLTYDVTGGSVTRTENLGAPRTVISGVGTTTTAFRQVTTPLRTVVVDIPIRSDNGGEFHLMTTVAGRNAWKPC